MSPRRRSGGDPGDGLSRFGDELLGGAEDAAGLLSGLYSQLTDAIRASAGATRAEARRAAAEGRPEVLRARYRREYLARRVHATERASYRHEPAPTARQAAGHPGPGDELPRTSLYSGGRLGGPGGVELLVGVSVDMRTARRTGIFMEAARRLLDGRLSPAGFDGRFGRWAPVVVRAPEDRAGSWRLATAAEVLALGAITGGEELVFDSGRRRARRSRSTARTTRPRRRTRRRP